MREKPEKGEQVRDKAAKEQQRSNAFLHDFLISHTHTHTPPKAYLNRFSQQSIHLDKEKRQCKPNLVDIIKIVMFLG